MNRLPVRVFAPSLATLLLCFPGCGRSGGEDQRQAEARPAQPSPWREVDHSMQVAVPAGAADAELAAAITKARATAEQARQRWQTAPPDQRGEWAAQWAAPTAGGRVEYVWVIPASWSPFRIEGTLASPPQQELACGKRAGDMVSFPAEELSDWLHDAADSRQPREGGFTIEALDKVFGSPR